MKFISLFAGVGGFDLGMEKAGHECVAQVEWDKNAAGVLKHRWPDVPLFCDVSKVTADDLPDADFITYGFPCQDLSVAGNRKGLEGERSGLFFEATRLFRELLGRGSGLRFAVAENVAGLFSADNGVALARCLRELLDCGACETAWRLLDSQYFGVAQRRKRVFIVSDFGGESCDQILAISQSLRGHPAPSRETGKDSPSNASGGFTPGSFGGYEEGVGTLRSQGGDLGGGSETLAVARMVAFGEYECDGTASTMKGRDHKDATDLVVQGCDVYNGEETGETAATVTTQTGTGSGSGPKVMGFYPTNRQPEFGNCEDMAPTVKVGSGSGGNPPGVCHETPASGPKVMGFSPYQGSAAQSLGAEEDKAPTLRGNGRMSCPAVCSWNGDTTPKASEDVSVTLRSQQGGEGVGVASNLTVRRLTPKECERLQGFPDDWTSERAELVLEGNEWKATGKVVKQADGPRYKQMGNAVTVNVAEWLGRRLYEV